MQEQPGQLQSQAGSKSVTTAERQLTVAYYVDPRSMHRVTIPLARANMILAVVLATVAWTIVSAVYLTFNARELIQGSEETPTAETKSEEKSTIAEKPIGASMAASLATKSIEQAEEIAEQDDATEVGDVADVAPVQEATEIEEPPRILPQDLSRKLQKLQVAGPKIALSSPELSSANGELSARFTIINKAARKTSGKVWGIATFVEASGGTLLIGSEANIDTEKPNAPESVEAAMGFSAQRLTNKELRFKAPSGLEGRFANLKIYAKPSDDEQAQVIEQEVAD